MQYINDDFFNEINFESDVIYVAIGSANNDDQQFLPLLKHFQKIYPLVTIQRILIDPNLEDNISGDNIIIQRKWINHTEMFSELVPFGETPQGESLTASSCFIPFLIKNMLINKLLIVLDFSGHDLTLLRKVIPHNLLRNILIGMEYDNANCFPDLYDYSLFPPFYRTDQGSIQFISAQNSFTNRDIAHFFISGIPNDFLKDNVMIHIHKIFDGIVCNNFSDWRGYMANHFGFCSNKYEYYSTDKFLSDINNKINFCEHINELVHVMQPFTHHCKIIVEQDHKQIYNASTIMKKCFDQILKTLYNHCGNNLSAKNVDNSLIQELLLISQEGQWIKMTN